ncbi:MAG: hypothetical protein RLW62_05710 [Gammaproteobacteria bacterium]
MRSPLLSSVLICLASLSMLHAGAAQSLDYAWEDRFDSAERARLGAWIEETAAALAALVGPFPMPVRIHFHRRDGSGEPVPWANTQRAGRQGVHFHVDPAYPPRAFRHDWTAPHELSHLVLPYLGRRHAWFAEGFASFMQYRVMQAMGVLTADAAEQRLRRRLARAAGNYDYPDEPFVETADRLRDAHRYPVLYWGGAVYFLQVDAALAARGRGLLAVLAEYLACCRRDRDSLTGLLQDLDRISDGDTFTATLATFTSRPGFPAAPRAPPRATD